MKLWAISDLHVGYSVNRRALAEVPERPDDWLIVAGDVGERPEQVEETLRLLASRFARLVWVPGNHELWCWPRGSSGARGAARYREMVEAARVAGAVTPEDPFPLWPGPGPPGSVRPVRIAPLFLHYDYTFRPDDVPVEDALAWAMETGLLSADEELLPADPFPGAADWCAERCRISEERLRQVPADETLVLVNHYPLRRELAWLPRIPRFSIWCGTRRTTDWHRRFRACAVVYGHLHFRSTAWRDGVRFEEVSLGYPKQWSRERGIAAYLREVLPGPEPPLVPRRIGW